MGVATDDRSGTLHSYTYNNANRLKTVTISGVLKGTYTYNGLEQLAVRDLPTSTPARVVHSIYDRKGNLIAEADGATGTTLREYLWLEEKPWLDDSSGLPDSIPLAVIVDVDTATPVTWYIHSDHLNRPIAVTDTAGAPVHEAWLPFGEASGSYVLNARFPGQWFQSENGLHYNWHRHYDPTIGRYTQADPLGFVDGPSVYAYALNSPQMYIDPDGRNTIEGLLLRRAAFAGGCALADGPFPVGDVVAVVILTATGLEIAYILYTRKSGKEKASDVPSWAKGQQPLPGESGKKYADRVMDGHYGEGNWRGKPRRGPGPGSEHNRLKKYGDRGGKGK